MTNGTTTTPSHHHHNGHPHPLLSSTLSSSSSSSSAFTIPCCFMDELNKIRLLTSVLNQNNVNKVELNLHIIHRKYIQTLEYLCKYIRQQMDLKITQSNATNY